MTNPEWKKFTKERLIGKIDKINCEANAVILRFDGINEKWLKKLFFFYIELFKYIDTLFWNKN